MTTETPAILCAVDFSNDSEAALDWAAGQSVRDNARLVVLHVVHDPAGSPGFYLKPDADWLRPMEEVAREMLERFIEAFWVRNSHLDGLLQLKTMLVTGLPPGRIAETAEAIDANQVVVGSRGRTGLPHLALGSVAQRVVQIVQVPVTVVKATNEAID